MIVLFFFRIKTIRSMKIRERAAEIPAYELTWFVPTTAPVSKFSSRVPVKFEIISPADAKKTATNNPRIKPTIMKRYD